MEEAETVGSKRKEALSASERPGWWSQGSFLDGHI